jgi:hypothetical protein
MFSMFLIGVNYLFLRWTGADVSAGVLLTIYMLVAMLIILPGVIAALCVGMLFEGWGVYAGLAILAAWELITAIGCFALSGGILHNCDMLDVKSMVKQ